ncbi:lipoprotein [uncultured Xylophilus sp.]|uniref:LPS translocon maturation chaperone LptM n=1 Tax=uncultured Xylophilus sp. TaxID=296832 RepID=UPI0025D0726A|nr:lipoprotein [uncultured Xylophilus sp.]
MLNVPQILVRAIALGGSVAVLAGCGQKGPLFLPTGQAAVGRATLPQTLRPRLPGSAPATPAAAAGATAPTPASPPQAIPSGSGGPFLSPAELVPESTFEPVTSSPSSPVIP